ncbi:N,N-dimethylformamidase beta subunit family domain-containing protein [Aquamicrobium sp. LC103]|uniref:N,N-dimethylformamidase beta subunit family domain-containing protein n=1 Tax=Aquamicrobium sp. LC103 TaxID=1120658 RepID=UPI00063EA537|nr:N,N-dimethylformamidase beta subunit family domain-containing protein [Aquamicrobium sp. LC103]TKT69299.1 N,N-dimethylformamidase [Aquamicrobium sp. LC103]
MSVETNRFLGYPDRLSVPTGERIVFHLSSAEAAVDAAIVRFRCADADASGPGLRYTVLPSPVDGEHPCTDQEIRPGSAAIVEDVGRLALQGSWSIGCHVWPTRLDDENQTLLARWCDETETGYALCLSPQRGLCLRLGAASEGPVEVFTDAPLRPRHWYWVSASFSAETGKAVLTQWLLADGGTPEEIIEREFDVSGEWALDAGIPFVMAAHAAANSPLKLAGHFDGKLDSPRIAAGIHAAAALRHIEPMARSGAPSSEVIAFWDFSIGIDTLVVRDLSANALHGRLHQLPRRAVTGVNWSGTVHDWRLAPREYGAIHFHSDDLYDCGWTPTLKLDVPADWRSGFYALRLRLPGEGDRGARDVAVESFIPFFVTPGIGRPRARLAVVASTATYLAYANSALRLYHVHFQGLTEHVLQLTFDDLYLQEHPELAQSTYDTHVDGSGRCYSSWLRPILNMRPRANPFNLVSDTHFIDWLEEQGIDYDVITDVELDREGVRAVEPYRVVCTLTHPEYYTFNMMNALLAYQNAGGRHICMGANSFYWRCAFHPVAPAALEVRRGMAGTRTWESQAGEVHLAGTGEPAALWRHSGFAPQKLVGVGFAAMVYDHPGYYLRTDASDDPRVSFIVEGIEKEERIGDFGVRIGGAVGIEIDRHDIDLGSPAHAIVLATSHGLGTGALPTPEEFRTMVHGLDGEQNALVRADMVFFETPNGGAVFATGSISFALSLSTNDYRNNVSQLTGNVVRRFLSDEPFAMPRPAA